MKKIILLLLGVSSFGFTHAQIGVHTSTPKVTLDVQAAATDGSTAEGMTAPRLTLAQLALKDAKYTSAQKGAIVFVTDVTDIATNATPKTINVIAKGYYYYDGTLWQTVGPEQSLGFFYMPSIVFPTNTSDPAYNNSTGTFTIDLYNLYSIQYGLTNSTASLKSPGATTLPITTPSNNIDYLISYYDNTVYQNVAVTAAGVLTYKLAPAFTATNKTFMNILFKLK